MEEEAGPEEAEPEEAGATGLGGMVGWGMVWTEGWQVTDILFNRSTWPHFKFHCLKYGMYVLVLKFKIFKKIIWPNEGNVI